MKNFFLIVILFTSLVSTSFADKQLTDYCKLTGGQIISSWTCPVTGYQKTGDTCKQTNSAGQSLYFNGCSAPDSKYKNLFFKACIIHDFCYHHEPQTTGKSKKNCDDQFLENMKKICKTSKPLSLDCGFAAQAFYLAVDQGGDKSFMCSKEKVPYPQNMDQLPWPSPVQFYTY